jgi:hypothetical protein
VQQQEQSLQHDCRAGSTRAWIVATPQHFDQARAGPPEVEFHLGYGDWIRLLRANGLEVVDLIEVQAPYGARSPQDLVDPEWARRYPAEEIWRARNNHA